MTFEEELEAARYNAEKRGYDKGVKQGIEQGFDKGIDTLAEALADLGMDVSLVAEGVERVRQKREIERKQ